MSIITLKIRTLISFSFILMFTCIRYAQSQPGELVIKKTNDFDINGKGTSSNWNLTEWFNLSPQKGPKQNIAGPNVPTRVKVMYSTLGMYFLFDCDDTILTASLKKDFERLFTEDVVEVFLWPDIDYPIYLEYEISPLNRELLILVPNLKGASMGWRPWFYEKERKVIHATSVVGGKRKYKSKVTNWKAEFFIPFSVMNPLVKNAPSSGTKWKGNFYRIDYDNKPTYYAWSKTSGSFHEYQKFGTLVFE